MATTATPKPTLYNAIWRWHFYAGLFCIPLVIWLALTGSIYLWRPQVEAWLDKPYDHLATSGPVATPEAQVAAALRMVPGATLHKYVLPQAPDSAVRVLVTDHGIDKRVYVDPRSLAVLKVATEEKRPFRLLFHLHGELLAGAVGSYIVEIAACWAVVMLLSGLYLWWPRGGAGLAGVLYPRLRRGSRIFWRDLHATTGIWVSVFALALILTGLPWAKGWGTYLGEIRAVTGTNRGPVDWTIGGKPPTPEPADNMAGMAGMPDMDAMPNGKPANGMHAMPPAVATGDDPHEEHRDMTMPNVTLRPGDLSRVVAAARTLNLAPPVLVMVPGAPGAPWSVSSDAADRPLRADAKIDGATGRIVSRTDFAERHWIDRAVGYGVAGHEGALFGIANQLLGTVTAIFLIMLAMSGAIMWWRRRPIGLLGAPVRLSRPAIGAGLIAIIVALGLYLPVFGATLILVLLTEKLLLRHLPKTRHWLGLAPT
jgi:uncharacterized iron-regulated membrane protein